MRKAFLDGLKTVEFSSGGLQMNERHEYHQTDTLIHEFCKLFGHHGVPEYGCGASGFLDYLNLMLIVLILIRQSTTEFVPKFLWTIKWEADIL